MTENEKTIKQAIRCVVGACDETCYHWSSGVCHGYEEVAKGLEKALEEIKQYRAIGTIEEFKAFKEKNTKKRFNIFESHGMRQFVCGCCDRPILTTDNYCSFCGQKLDWQ